ncbi:MAG: hypothetical protein K2V38_18645 [Gemmataceae bacterium]|nr:hypothetical protein [Gemmataceae bacterium]
MAVRHMRLGFGLFMLFAGLALLGLRVFAPETAAKLNDLTRLTIAASLAVVMGGVNLARWYAGWLAFQQSATPVRLPLQPDPTASAEPEYNPEFDFTKPAPGEHPPNPERPV